MNKAVYIIDCITNLHVGSGDLNYNIIDNEVEKDPVTGYPMINSSGLKGALKEYFEGQGKDAEFIKYVFGSKTANKETVEGKYKFMDAHLLSRPMRVSGSSEIASINVFSVASVNGFIKKLKAFGINTLGNEISSFNFGNNTFLSSVDGIRIENENTRKLTDDEKIILSSLSMILGEKYAFVNDFNQFELPVIARNCLEENNSNLWYEEVVPATSRFYTTVLFPNDNKMVFNDVVQIGGNASIGCGYTRITQLA